VIGKKFSEFTGIRFITISVSYIRSNWSPSCNTICYNLRVERSGFSAYYSVWA